MPLSNDIISQFVKNTVDEERTSNESTVFGFVVVEDGNEYVQIDGSSVLTPIRSTISVKTGDRVTVLIKDHTAIAIGNLTSRSIGQSSTQDQTDRITKLEIAVADKVSTEQLAAEVGRIEKLEADNLTVRGELDAAEGYISELQADNIRVKERLTATEGEISHLEAEKLDVTAAEAEYAKIEDLEATDLEVYNLKGTHAEFQEATAKNFEAANARIDKISAGEIDTEALKSSFAQIDFSNIGVAAITRIFGTSGIIKDLVVGDQTLTGELVGVTLSGDLIKGNTVKADKLVVKGSDGLYYKLNIEAGAVASTEVSTEDLQNGLHGTAIIAKTITAEKISVSDLVAFGATIGGFHITDNSLYSGAKSSVDNTTQGIYLDSEGQAAIGDSNNFLKYYQDASGNYILEVSASSIVLGSSKKNVETAIDEVNTKVDDISVGGRNLLKNSRHVKLSSNNSSTYPITSETLTEDGREFKRYRRTSIDSYVTTMSTYSVIPLTDITECLTGEEMTFSFLIRCSHEVETSIMGTIRIDGTTYTWHQSSEKYPIGLGWTRLSVTATIEQEYEKLDSNLLRFNPLNMVIPEGEIENFYFDVCEWKIEKGNKVTDWTPAPEDMASGESVDEVRDMIEGEGGANERIGAAESLIQSLSDSISMLVTDGNGTSLMTQTETGWTFSTADIQDRVDKTSEDLNSLVDALGDTNGAVDILKQAVNDLGTIAEYVKIGTYEDEPCIELGEGDSDFKLLITNTRIMFKEGTSVPAYFNNQSMHIKKAVVEEELQQGGFVWKVRSNGNLGLVWKGVTS